MSNSNFSSDFSSDISSDLSYGKKKTRKNPSLRDLGFIKENDDISDKQRYQPSYDISQEMSGIMIKYGMCDQDFDSICLDELEQIFLKKILSKITSSKNLNSSNNSSNSLNNGLNNSSNNLNNNNGLNNGNVSNKGYSKSAMKIGRNTTRSIPNFSVVREQLKFKNESVDVLCLKSGFSLMCPHIKDWNHIYEKIEQDIIDDDLDPLFESLTHLFSQIDYNCPLDPSSYKLYIHGDNYQKAGLFVFLGEVLDDEYCNLIVNEFGFKDGNVYLIYTCIDEDIEQIRTPSIDESISINTKTNKEKRNSKIYKEKRNSKNYGKKDKSLKSGKLNKSSKQDKLVKEYDLNKSIQLDEFIRYKIMDLIQSEFLLEDSNGDIEVCINVKSNFRGKEKLYQSQIDAKKIKDRIIVTNSKLFKEIS